MSKKTIYLLFVDRKLVGTYHKRESAFKAGLCHDKPFEMQKYVVDMPPDHDGIVYVASCCETVMFQSCEIVLGVFVDHDKACLSFDPYAFADFDISIFQLC